MVRRKCRFFVDPGSGQRNQVRQDWSPVAVFRSSRIQSHFPLKCRPDRDHDVRHITKQMEVREMKSFPQSQQIGKSELEVRTRVFPGPQRFPGCVRRTFLKEINKCSIKDTCCQ